MSFPMDASLGEEPRGDSSPQDSLQMFSTATDVLELLGRADAVTPAEIDLWAALVLGESPKMYVHCPRPPSPTATLALADSMKSELCDYGGEALAASACAKQVRLSCASLDEEVMTGLTDAYRDHLTQRGDEVVGMTRAAATHTEGLTLDRWRQAEEALELAAWMLGSLAVVDERRQGFIDPISGVYTRSFFEEALHNELVRHTRRASEVAVIVLQLRRSGAALTDVQPAPALLVFVARALKDTLRMSDVVARVESRQFAVLMPDTNPRAGLIAANRLGEALRDAHELDGWSIDIGISGVGLEVAGSEELLSQAEKAMRAAERRRTKHPFVYV